ncbi:MAG: flagellar FlbD family protein [Bacteroidetes bacterium]|nr:flagellar FlbD family protein [Bacteroidota bacterium]
MVRLTQINGEEIVVNAELIETIEKAHDTIITLTTSRKIRVREEVEDVINKTVEYKRRIARPEVNYRKRGVSKP